MTDSEFERSMFDVHACKLVISALGKGPFFDICPIRELVELTNNEVELIEHSTFKLLQKCHCMNFSEMSDDFKLQLGRYCKQMIALCHKSFEELEPEPEVIEKKSIFQRLLSTITGST